jgi:uncharacterized protein (TIGR03066 family)
MNTSSHAGEPPANLTDQGVPKVKVTRAILFGLLAAGLTSCSGSSTSGGSGASSGGDNAAKIVGTWQSQKKNEGDVCAEFTKDGKLKFLVRGEVAMEGTYKVAGDQCTITLPEQKPDTATIQKLTDTELELKDADGKVEKYKKK